MPANARARTRPTSSPAAAPSGAGIRAGGAGRRTSSARNKNGGGGGGGNSAGRVNKANGGDYGESDNDSLSDGSGSDDDGMGDIESDPPRPPPRKARPNGKAAPASDHGGISDDDSDDDMSDVESDPPRPPPRSARPNGRKKASPPPPAPAPKPKTKRETSSKSNAAKSKTKPKFEAKSNMFIPAGPADSDSDSDDDNDDDNEVESDPPRPPPRAARSKPAAAKATTAPKSKPKPKTKAETEDEDEDVVISPKRPPPRKAAPKRAPARAVSKGAAESTGLTDSSSEDEDVSDGIEFIGSDESDDSVDSDDLDDDDFGSTTAGKRKGRAPGPPVKKAKVSASKAKGAATKGRAKAKDSDEEIELEEGQTVVGRIHPAPKTGWVPKGQISANTLEFLGHLMYDEYNDRGWFKSHEPWFRKAEQEWRDFVQVLQTKMAEKDTQLPIVPARDLCHRIYRDVRFSSDKSPYKANFGMSTSRSGRKGIWAGYHLYLCPGDVFLACGSWQPEKDILQRIRARLMAPGGAQPLRNVISAPEFVKLFGEAKPLPNGGRRNIFGHPDQLKVAPKGVDKTHPEIDLLKLRSMTVLRRFTDKQVLSADFADLVADTVGVMAPFIHVLNSYIAPVGQVVDDSDSDLSGVEIVEP